jgi:hypothetical protein
LSGAVSFEALLDRTAEPPFVPGENLKEISRILYSRSAAA